MRLELKYIGVIAVESSGRKIAGLSDGREVWHGSEGDVIPVGRPPENVRAYVGNEGRLPVPLGVAGELYIGGGGVAQGYLHRPELTAAKIIRREPFWPASFDYRPLDPPSLVVRELAADSLFFWTNGDSAAATSEGVG